MAEAIVSVKNLSKEFVLPQHRHTSLKQVFVNIGRQNTKKQQRVLNNIDLQIQKGEFFGIVGRNGSGKSTLLKILAGVYAPTKGEVYVGGTLTPFIELGVGFNPELTGRDNVFLNGALLGFNRKEMEAMYDDIVKFAELEPFMDQKLKNYSSGMQVRLAFSIAIRAKSDILLIDEVLAVGDANFQKKCMETFESLKQEGRTIIFITHSMEHVRTFCDRVAVIDKSNLLFVGDTEKAIDVYNKLNQDDEKVRLELENQHTSQTSERLGSGKATIVSHKLLNRSGRKSVELETSKEFEVKLHIVANETIHNCAVGVMFRKDPHENLYGINNYYNAKPIKVINSGQAIDVTFADKLPLNPGTYYVSFAISGMKDGDYEDFDNLNNIMRVNVVGPKTSWGVVHSSPNITVGGIND